MPLPSRVGLALASVLLQLSRVVSDAVVAGSCAAPDCAESDASGLMQTRGVGRDFLVGSLQSTERSQFFKKSALIVIDMQNDFVHPNGTLSGAGANVDVVEPINKLLSEDWGIRIFTADNHPHNHVSFAKTHVGDTTPNGPFPIVKVDYSRLAGTPTAKICGSKYMSKYGEAGTLCNDYPTSTGEVFSPDVTVPQETYPVHCVQSTWGQKIYSGLNFSYDNLNDIIFFKGQNAHIDSYSAIFNNLACTDAIENDTESGELIPQTCMPKQRPYPEETQIAHLLKSNGVEQVFFVGLCLDYCVKFSAIHAAWLGKKAGNRWRTFVIEDATRNCNPSLFHQKKSLSQMKEAGVNIIKAKSLRP